ncbi:MAG: aminoglycoside phosphotransferase family protein [Acidimicrobiales bacterium]
MTGRNVVRVRRLPGASSAAVHRLDLDDATAVVLRRYLWKGFLESEPDAPAREVDCVHFARAAGLAVPDVIAVDLAGDDIGDGVPAILMSFLRGRVVAVPNISRLAEVAASIHAIDADQLGHDYFAWYDSEMMTPPPGSSSPELWDRAIEIRRTQLAEYTPTLIHRDFHPGNVMWLRGQLSGVVDWANACRGPFGCDLAHCRSNLRELAGIATGDEFVAAYQSLTGDELHPYWVLAGHLEHSHRHWNPERLARDEPDLALAVSELG